MHLSRYVQSDNTQSNENPSSKHHSHRKSPFPRRAARIATISTAALIAGAAIVGPATADNGSDDDHDSSKSSTSTNSTDTSSTNTTSSKTSTTTATTTGSTATSAAAASAAITGPRPFKSTSYWNTPLGKAPRDPHSAAYIRDSQAKAHTQGYLKLVIGDWGMPVYRSTAKDPVYRINPGTGPTVRVHIPRRAKSMPTSDAALTVWDRSTNQIISMGGAHFGGSTWNATGLARYYAGTNGIAQGLPTGSKGNIGHRGIPGSVAAVTKREIQRGAIRHRLEVYWWETASRTPTGKSAYFPMTGSESGKNGKVPEGIVIRIKPSVNLKAKHLSPAAYTIARALQRYGAVVGDNSGTGNALKLQANTNWGGILNKDSLHSIKWSDFMFVKGGYRP